MSTEYLIVESKVFLYLWVDLLFSSGYKYELRKKQKMTSEGGW